MFEDICSYEQHEIITSSETKIKLFETKRKQHGSVPYWCNQFFADTLASFVSLMLDKL